MCAKSVRSYGDYVRACGAFLPAVTNNGVSCLNKLVPWDLVHRISAKITPVTPASVTEQLFKHHYYIKANTHTQPHKKEYGAAARSSVICPWTPMPCHTSARHRTHSHIIETEVHLFFASIQNLPGLSYCHDLMTHGSHKFIILL